MFSQSANLTHSSAPQMMLLLLVTLLPALVVGKATVGCHVQKSFKDPDIGEMSLNPSKYCDMMCTRGVPLVTCCQPSQPDSMNITFTLYPGKGGSSRLLNWRDAGDKKYFRGGDRRVIFVIHGFIEAVNYKFMDKFRDAFLHNTNDDVIIMDWAKAHQKSYHQSIANARTAGAMIGKAIVNWGIASRTLLVGHSLGCPTIHEAAVFVKKNSNEKVNECHALDPAGPGFDGCKNDIYLNKDDCNLVQVVHTNANTDRLTGIVNNHLGSYSKQGHCDYWINCGHDQPCKQTTGVGEGMKVCSHDAAVQLYFLWLQKQQVKDLPAFPCPECGQAPKCLKDKSPKTQKKFMSCTPDQDANYYAEISGDVLVDGGEDDLLS